MKIILLAATSLEIQAVLNFLDQNGNQINLTEYTYKKHSVHPLISGVGSPLTAFALGRYLHLNNMDLLLHVGICGSYQSNAILGEVIEVSKERWADMGAEDQNNNLIDVFELGLCNANQFPFSEGWIENVNNKINTKLRTVSGLTVNKTSGNSSTIEKLKSKYSAEVESMEGAAVFYSARMRYIPFLSIRAISNIVEPRNKDNWKIQLAVQNLNQYIISFLEKL
ncbi:MAG: futalosine hydrolase [Saprospiraceae bacterium]